MCRSRAERSGKRRRTGFWEVHKSGDVATLTLSREKVNALNGPVVDKLRAALETLEGESEVRAIILTGSGGAGAVKFQRLSCVRKELIMKTILAVAILLCACAHAQAQKSPDTSARPKTSTAQELIALNQELIDALARGDKSVVERIYADDFVRTSTQGETFTKAQLLASLKVPEPGVKIVYESKDIQVFDYGNAAVLVYLSIRHTDNKGEKSDFLYRVTDTFVKSDGRWVKAASAGTPVLAKTDAPR